MNSVGIWINTVNLLDIGLLSGNLEKYELFGQVIRTNKNSFNSKSLFLDIPSSVYDFEYVVYINPLKIMKEDQTPANYNRQRYAIETLLENIPKAIRILEENKRIGMLTPPMDIVKVSNWDNYEDWVDFYYLTRLWGKLNKFQVPIDEGSPPVAMTNGCAIFRVKALAHVDKLEFDCFAPSFLSYALPLFVQENGFLPAYISSKNIGTNNILGYESMVSWISKLADVKKEYYSQLKEYCKQSEEYCKQVTDRLQYLEKQNVQLEEKNRKLIDENHERVRILEERLNKKMIERIYKRLFKQK